MLRSHGRLFDIVSIFETSSLGEEEVKYVGIRTHKRNLYINV